MLGERRTPLTVRGGVAAATAAMALLVAVASTAAAVDLHTSAEPVRVDAGNTGAATTTQTQAVERTDGFDPSTCRPQPTAADPSATGAGAPGQTGVGFVVPPTTRISVNEVGQPVSVSTNTAQAPCVSDIFLAVAPDGSTAVADGALRDRVLRIHVEGTWEAGIPLPVSASAR